MSAPDVAPDGRARGRDLLVEFPQEELIAKWEEFFDEAGYQSRIIAVADRYPEERSLEVSFEHLNRFDTDMAIYLLRHPLNVLMAGEEAIRRLSPPGEEVLQIHLRIKGLPRDRRVQIRDLRAKHLGQYITVEGLVRKSTEVRPRVVGALFQCLRCGTILKEEQDGQAFREPLECYEEQGGCKRSASATKFKLLTETSLYLDTQKIEIQEAPEGLRGGAEPQRLTAYVEDDLTGHITPGQRLILNGILRSVQKGRPGAKSTLFDIFVDVNSVEMEQVEFEEIEVTEEDARLIREAGSSPDIVRMMVNSIAPSIYGMHTEKEALALQLFSGVPKTMPDGRRIRGDIHLILVGDPGTAKSELLSYMSRLSPRGIYATGKAASAAGLCVGGESIIVTDRGMTPIEELARPYFPDPVRQRPLETRAATGEVTTFDDRHAMVTRPLEAMWRVKAAPFVLRVVTASGLSLRVTPATKLLVDHAMGQSWIRAKFLRKGMRVATARALPSVAQPPPLILDLLRTVDSRIVVTVAPDLVGRILRGLRARDGSLREAARKLLLDEDALYHRWRNDRHAIPLEPLLRSARAAGLTDDDVARSIRRYSQARGHRIRLPISLNEDLAYFAGLIAGDGSVEEGAMGGFSIRFANSDEGLIRSYGELVRSLFDVSVDFTPQSPQRAASSRFHSKLVAALLRALGVPTSPKSSSLSIPDLLLNARPEILGSYLRGLYDTDGTIGERRTGGTCVSLSTTSPALARQLQIALLRFGIRARIRTRRVAGRRSVRRDGRVIVSRHDQYVLDIYGWSSHALFKQHIGFRHPRKAARLGALSSRTPHSNVDLISSAGQHFKEIREALGLTPAEAYGPQARFGRTVESGRMGAGHESLTSLTDSLEARYESREWRGCRVRIRPYLLDKTRNFFRTRRIGPRTLASLLAISAENANDYFFRARRPRTPAPALVLQRLWRVLRLLSAPTADEMEAEIRPILHRIEKVSSRLAFIRTLASSDVRWEPVQAIDVIRSDNESTLYDLTVRDAHAFVANGILVHNTAAAVRDEFGEGRWTLEAGALVLADKGLACLHPSSEVLIDGVPRQIDTLFDPATSMKARSRGDDLEISPIDAQTVGLDLPSLTSRQRRVTLVARRVHRGPILHVTLDSGFVLRLTPEHRVLDGETLEWRRLDQMRPGARFVSSQKLPGHSEPLHVLDLIPDEWIVQPTSADKQTLKSLLLGKFATITDANRAYGLSRDCLSGRSAMRVSQFRRILRDLGIHEIWRQRIFAFGRARATERLRIAILTPALAYLFGFIYGDGHVAISSRRSSISIFQSRVHLRYIQRLLQATKAVTSRPWGMHFRWMDSEIRGRKTTSPTYQSHRGSVLLAHLYTWVTANDLQNLLRLDDEALRGFIAGLMDSDGSISIKRGRKGGKQYSTVDIEFMISSSPRANKRLMLALRRFDVYSRLRHARGVLRVQVIARNDVAELLETISPYSGKFTKVPVRGTAIPGRHEEAPPGPTVAVLRDVEPRPVAKLERNLWGTFYELARGTRRPYKGTLQRLSGAIDPWLTDSQRQRLAALFSRDFALERIAEIRVEEFDGYVYDLRVPEGENFLCEGVSIHNCIDEIDKMNPQDRSAIHEALEQQRVSVAKAGITAVLQARCAVLAAANPKFGRFDEHKYIAEQIDLPPALLSRFDIIFSLIDRPEAGRDRQMAEHILRGHKVGEIVRRQEEGLTAPTMKGLEEPYTPHFSPDFLRKYVAFAKRIYPVMTDEVMAIIEKKYLDIRKTGEAAGSSVPITPRQLEAIIRLSEASARLRLSETVSVEDAERSIRIVEYWMGKVAGEEGRFDIDIIQTGISQSQREQIIALRDIISELAGPEGVADYEDIVRVAQDRGIPPARVDAWLKRWAQEGEIYSPAKNKYKLVERL